MTSAETVSNLPSVLTVTTNSPVTIKAGMSVQTTSSTLLLWVCGGQLRIGRATPVADHAPQQQALDEDEDGDGNAQHDWVEVGDVLAGLADGLDGEEARPGLGPRLEAGV